MMSDINKSNQKLLQVLWEEINWAIINSKSVRSLIKQLHDMGAIDNIIEKEGYVSMKALVEEILKQNENGTEKNSPEVGSDCFSGEPDTDPEEGNPRDNLIAIQNELLKEAEGRAQWVDGKKLSRNEVRYLEFAADHFDEARWLKNAGICF
ncbi:hypothetical protein UR09_03825 [Candidatus Nitromaritima sp. SCGC AAA799-A02]|nr:hypothetical protein UR09_03825 [Candidatus Nitromaritima sp. SCGC AAA799-A02]KMP12196.1 hypothetical protein UZ36_01930 [Candidatus Nitromaritima sp. SCGC AAA799-C22]